MPYTAADKTIEQVLKDYETGVLNAEFKGSTLEYLHAVIAAKAAQTQQRWARVAPFAACTSVVVAAGAVLVASLR